jgi:hypothetical protein
MSNQTLDDEVDFIEENEEEIEEQKNSVEDAIDNSVEDVERENGFNTFLRFKILTLLLF